MRLFRLIGLAILLVLGVHAAGPVYIVLWFDTEDYVDPRADDSALRIATDLTDLGVRATFKLVGEKARVLESRGRTDVIRALSKHAIGYHSNWHSIPPTPSFYLRRLGYLDGAAEFERREKSGVADIRRIFGVTPICYGQPGSSWAPQPNLALRRMGIPVYLDEAKHVGIGGQPFWYGGMFYIFNMAPNLYRPALDQKEPVDFAPLDAIVKRLADSGGGVISSYYHPTEFVNREFWDAANFAHGALPPRSEWKLPRPRTAEESERGFRILRAYAAHARALPGVHFVTAQDLLQLYEGPIAPPADRARIAAHLARKIVFLDTGSNALSPADMLLQLLGVEPRVVDGPLAPGKTTLKGGSIRADLFARSKADVADFIRTHHRLPSEAFIGTETLSLADFTATLARAEGAKGDVQFAKGELGFDPYFAIDPVGAFQWPIHPEGFSAPELLEMARLQGWTLKPARLR